MTYCRFCDGVVDIRKGYQRMLKRIFLLAGAIGWGVAVLGVFLPWHVMNGILRNMGAAAPVVDPMIRYWFRMATGGWSMIGFFHLMALLFPRKYDNLIPLLAYGTLFEGAVLLCNGIILDIPLFPFAGDVGFCFIVGAGLLFSNIGNRGGNLP